MGVTAIHRLFNRSPIRISRRYRHIIPLLFSFSRKGAGGENRAYRPRTCRSRTLLRAHRQRGPAEAGGWRMRHRCLPVLPDKRCKLCKSFRSYFTLPLKSPLVSYRKAEYRKCGRICINLSLKFKSIKSDHVFDYSGIVLFAPRNRRTNFKKPFSLVGRA